MRGRLANSIWFICLYLTLPALAQREPVLKQIAHPHNYYFREMYLPQLTSGPSSVTWSPDGKEVIFSMKGSLWRQSLASTTAVQLTDGPGYDYQPDWSPDGRYVVYTKYHDDALELCLLDLQTNKWKQITKNAAATLDPRWSPDGSRIAFVSTAYNRYFHIFVMSIENDIPKTIERVTAETTTAAKRYYYSQVDHEISPAWSPDGKDLLFVYNHDRIYGTGGFWRQEARTGAPPKLIYYEDTTWRARPDWSRDGRRIVYASYDRRQWHQLWMTTPDGGDPLPLTFGEYDNTSPRWSPDGKQIAFISNRSGNTELWTVQTVGGMQRKIEQKELKYRNPVGKISLTVLDESGKPSAARVFVRAAGGRFFGPDDAWLHADDSFVPADNEFKDEPRYFHTTGHASITLPSGKARLLAMKGFEYELARQDVTVSAGANRPVTVRLKRLPPLPGATRWVSSDLHVHMNYGGNYRNTPERLLAQARAENLNIVNDLIVNKEQRIPDIGYFSTKPDRASTADHVLLHGQEFHTSYWGHVGLLNLKQHYLLPDYSAYQNSAMASPYPTNTVVADLTHNQGGLMGYVHPYEIEDMPDPSAARNHALPVDVALGKVDYLEVLGFSDHHMTASVWHRLLNLGFKIPAGAGTDAMANYASLRGPIGTNRTYVNLPLGPINPDAYMRELKAGRTFSTNAPLVQLTVGGKRPGETLTVKSATAVPFSAALRSYVGLDHLEIVCNGKVVRSLALTGKRTVADVNGTLPIDSSGWCLLRAYADKPTYPVLDIYPYGTTSAIYVDMAGRPQTSPADATYFVNWVDHLIARTKENANYNTPEERAEVLKSLESARAIYAAKQ
jgi:dipeptidyl aminopeptidase/acylaminoacyl peptidase